MTQNTLNKHISSFYIAGFTFWDGCMAFNELKVGRKLRLVREEDKERALRSLSETIFNSQK